MESLSRSSKITVAIIAIFVVGAVALIAQSRWSAGQIPQEFKDARLQGALTSQAIVDYSNSLSGQLQKINDLEKKGKIQDALAATNDIIAQSQSLRGKAVDLSHQLEIMAQSLPNISSADARQAALDAIASRLALISRLVNYSNYLGDLFAALRDRFSLGSQLQAKIDMIISQINMEVVAINNFDKNATASMNRLDTIVNGQ